MIRSIQIVGLFFLLTGSAFAQYSTPVRIVGQPVLTQPSKEVVNLVEQVSITGTLTLPEQLIVVPAGRRLVITAAAVDTGINSCVFTLNPRIRISRLSSPNLVMFPLGRTSASTFGSSGFVNQATFPVTIYAEAGDAVRFDLFRSNNNCVSVVRFSISGYLEDDS